MARRLPVWTCNACGKTIGETIFDGSACDCKSVAARGGFEDVISVPIFESFDTSKLVGLLTLKKQSIPKSVRWVVSIGYKLDKAEYENGIENITNYELVSGGLISDDDFLKYMKGNKPICLRCGKKHHTLECPFKEKPGTKQGAIDEIPYARPSRSP